MLNCNKLWPFLKLYENIDIVLAEFHIIRNTEFRFN